jgi:broad specificity phosphatase PhoE
MMPIDLVLVRHGESEGNVAGMHSRSGNDEFYTEAFRKKPSSQWRLSDRGIQQAKVAGDWIRQNCPGDFDRHYVSEYLRAVETAHLLNFEHAEWRLELYLREREWGDLDTVPHRERLVRFAEAMERKDSNSLFWRPPNGESIADLCLRVDRVLDTLHRECSDKRVLIVGHGEVMWTFRIRLERMSQHRYLQKERSDDPLDHIHNCQIIHYTRRDPGTGQLGPFLNWMRSVCPWDSTRSRNQWEAIERPLYSTSDLSAVIEGYPRLVNC